MIDELCDLLETKRINLVKVVTDLDNSESTGIATIDEIKEVISAVENGLERVQDVKYTVEEIESQADNAKYDCDNAETYLSDAHGITASWKAEIKGMEEAKKEEKLKEIEQEEINNSNQYEMTK
jgi:conjugal transfer/entry exclusion protein